MNWSNIEVFDWINLLFGGAGFFIASFINRYKEIFIATPMFLQPEPNDEVKHLVHCEGTCSRWFFSQPIWIFVSPVHSGRYYPQRQTVTKDLNGKWRSVAYVGSSPETDIDQDFVLYTVTANLAGTSTIREYIAQCIPGEEWPGLDQWPNGCTPKHAIFVTHKE